MMWGRLADLTRRRALDGELETELAHHFDALVSEHQSRGLTPDDARTAARRDMGGLSRVREAYRDQTGFSAIAALGQDIRYALRTLRRSPGFAIVAILTLALGIGANTAIFSTLHALLIRPLPYQTPDRVAMIWEDASAVGFPRNTPAPGNYSEWLRLNQSFEGLAATRSASANLTLDGPPEQVAGRAVTASFFTVLGTPPLLGRAFTDDEDRTGAPVVVISYGLWQRRYGGAPDIVGQTLQMNGARQEVIGVMPRSFVFRNREIDYWVPIHFSAADLVQRNSHFLNVVGRLKPGVTAAAADADMRRVSEVLQRQFPDSNARVTTVVVPIQDDLLGDTKLQMIVLMGASLAVLLIACANLASLLLSRTVARRAEFAARAALGATRGRLIRQSLVEGLALSFLGGAAGLLMARTGSVVLTDLVPMGFSSVDATLLDWRLLAFAAVVSTAAALIFSVVPAIGALHESSFRDNRQATRAVVGSHRVTRDVLVVVQVAAALALLASAGLMVRTLANLRAIDLGFQPDHLLTLRTTLPRTQYAEISQRLGFYDRVLTKVRGLPGVESAAYGATLPFMSIGNTNGFQIEGVTLDPDDQADALWRVGTTDYLRTLGVTLVEGRLFDTRDGAGTPRSVVINETMARRYFPRDSAVGHRFRFFGDAFFTVIGVVRDVRERGYELAMKPAVYVAAEQLAIDSSENLVIRVSGDPMRLASAVRAIVASIDPNQSVAAIRTMDEIVALNVADRGQQMTLLVVFAGLALFLAAVGLYAVLSYLVVQRRREIGLRVALGATRGTVMRMVATRGLLLTGAGASIGLALAWAVSRTMQSLLYGVTPGDPVTIGAATALLIVIAFVAMYVPARRATKVDPWVALRYE